MDIQKKVEYLKARDSKLSKVIDRIGALEAAQLEDPFRFLAREIVGQMLSIKVRDVIWQRIQETCGGSVTPSAILNLAS